MVQRKVISSHKHSNERLSYDHAHLNTFEKVNFRLPCVFGNFSSAVLYGRSSSREREGNKPAFVLIWKWFATSGCQEQRQIRKLRCFHRPTHTRIRHRRLSSKKKFLVSVSARNLWAASVSFTTHLTNILLTCFVFISSITLSLHLHIGQKWTRWRRFPLMGFACRAKIFASFLRFNLN